MEPSAALLATVQGTVAAGDRQAGSPHLVPSWGKPGGLTCRGRLSPALWASQQGTLADMGVSVARAACPAPQPPTSAQFPVHCPVLPLAGVVNKSW